VTPVTEKVAPVTPTKYHPTPADIAMNMTAGTKYFATSSGILCRCLSCASLLNKRLCEKTVLGTVLLTDGLLFSEIFFCEGNSFLLFACAFAAMIIIILYITAIILLNIGASSAAQMG
jgi:hypothetical protein